ncbi:type II toxin-antitoxin system death-on-curing family toxin [Thermoleptolyngbya sp. C42_A2020_037]|uniref:type II toxin-antitoxin system death-on-curing family toxin n=1 Tax=Thermoleptolyngbya sp. C42_A2020_037 TaxID=2747799 RepID=UPI001A022555|nr:type II toxin-antitoxin system death-on-curing family toxin [Thermoleptolyngbya sp. C42_A2020_037]MBF2084391.1 type II toxin-antitoxin system death-on-curing family toxin [Thermoleptolyngbya sp. C42_A2020_037]
MQTPEFLSIADVLVIHADQIDSFGGSPGVRDQGLLESALAQPQATFGGEFLHATIAQQAAAYLYHLAMNHPFIDGNKRTAFAAMDAFLRLNGVLLGFTDDEAYQLVIRVVEGALNKDELADILQAALQE